jgi:hypothetical protein
MMPKNVFCNYENEMLDSSQSHPGLGVVYVLVSISSFKTSRTMVSAANMCFDGRYGHGYNT